MLRCTIRLKGMATEPLRVEAIEHIIRNRMAETGVDNYRFAGGVLMIGATRYAVEPCGCRETECDGVHLRPVGTIRRH